MTIISYEGKNIRIFWAFIFFYFITSSLAACAANQESDKVNQLKAFVNSGVGYINKYGKKAAYRKFSDTKGEFRKGSLYLFVYDYHGKCLAHGGDPNNFVGKNLIDYKDHFGTPVLKLIIKTAKLGGGFVYFYWMNPQSKQVEFKTTYVKSLDNDTLIGSGLYEFIEVGQQIQESKVEAIKAFVRTGAEYYYQYGPAAFKVFNNPKGPFVKGEWYLFVFDYNGKVYANIDANLVGTNIFNLTDEFGTPFIQLLIEAAKSGGGIVSYYWKDIVTKKILIKTSYVMPLDKNYFIGAGYYTH